ncbi:hypothetical protein GCM10029963_53570 [Micromonospora andamanensis]|uniref:hypothetical protein n=1 Tax=Micromonospora andamanensis TaxID=1287068 RepID=UPI001950ED39|nr:hypothetical protein [Micromonospora andamanensis]GIJ36718.1 hypothetical protein Vwe01_00430 [Micromonospora andamanensis]
MGRETQGFAALPPSQRQLAAGIGALHRWSRIHSAEGRAAGTAPAREARRRRLEQQADPDGLLSPKELEAAVDRLSRAHMRKAALASAKARAARKRVA